MNSHFEKGNAYQLKKRLKDEISFGDRIKEFNKSILSIEIS